MSDFSWNDFDASSKDYDQDATIPAGWYTVAITKAEMKPTNKGGERLAMEVEILDGQYKGRKVFPGFNLRNPNPKAVEIAKKELAALCRALGIVHPKNESELMRKPVQAKLAVRPETSEFPAQNEVKDWRAAGAAIDKPFHVTVSFPKSAEPVAESGEKKPLER